MGQACTQQIVAPARRAPQTLAELAVTALPSVECWSCCGPRPGNYPDVSSLGPNHKQWPPGEPQVLRRPRGVRQPCLHVARWAARLPCGGTCALQGPPLCSCNSCVLSPRASSPSTRRLLGQGGVSSARAAGSTRPHTGPAHGLPWAPCWGPTHTPGTVSGFLAGPHQNLVFSVVLDWPAKLCLAYA